MDEKEKLSAELILQAVATWPSAQRFDLIHKILRTLEPPVESSFARRPTLNEALGIAATGQTSDPAQKREPTLHQALGLLATDQPPPTDEEVEQWLEERRMEKYG